MAVAVVDKPVDALQKSLEKASRYLDANEHRLAADELLKLGTDVLEKARRETMLTANFEGKRGHEEERERLISLASSMGQALRALKGDQVGEEAPTL